MPSFLITSDQITSTPPPPLPPLGKILVGQGCHHTSTETVNQDERESTCMLSASRPGSTRPTSDDAISTSEKKLLQLIT